MSASIGLDRKFIYDFINIMKTIKNFQHVALKSKPLMIPVLGFVGLCYLDRVHLRRGDDDRDKIRQLLVWDFFDPMGHHQLDE